MKNKIYTCIFISLLFLSEIKSQGYSGYFGGAKNDHATCMQRLSLGNLIVGTTTSFGGSGKDLYVFKTDFNGNLLWSRTIGQAGDEEAYSVTKCSDNNYVITGYTKSFSAVGMDNYNALLTKIDSNGMVLWSYIYGGDSADVGLSVIEATNKDLVITGYTKSMGGGAEDIMLIRTDMSGKLKWMKAYGDVKNQDGASLKELDNGDIILTGTTQLIGGIGGNQVIAVKTDSSGKVKWQKSITNSPLYTYGPPDRIGYDVIYTSDKNLLFAGKMGTDMVGASYPFLIKTDTSGKFIWSKCYTVNTGQCGAYKCLEIPGSNIIVAAYQPYSSIYSPVLFEVDLQQGNESWMYCYGMTTFTYPAEIKDISYDPSVGLTATGSFINANNDTNAFVMTTGLNGLASCAQSNSNIGFGLTTTYADSATVYSYNYVAGGNYASVTLKDSSVNSTSVYNCKIESINHLGNNENNIRIFPNPCSNILNINSSSLSYTPQAIKLYDVLGNCQMEEILQTENTTLNISLLSSGIYFYSITNNNSIITKGKIQIIK